MVLDLFGAVFNLKFMHTTTFHNGLIRRTTIAEVVPANKLNNVYIECAYCHPKDQFNKKIGRKLALTKVLKSLKWDKEIRTMVWNQYFKHIGGVK
jgi:hypothetical protein